MKDFHQWIAEQESKYNDPFDSGYHKPELEKFNYSEDITDTIEFFPEEVPMYIGPMDPGYKIINSSEYVLTYIASNGDILYLDPGKTVNFKVDGIYRYTKTMVKYDK